MHVYNANTASDGTFMVVDDSFGGIFTKRLDNYLMVRQTCYLYDTYGLLI